MTDKQKANAIFSGISFRTFLSARPELIRTSRNYPELFFCVFEYSSDIVTEFKIEALTAEDYPSEIGAPDLYTVYRNGESYR